MRHEVRATAMKIARRLALVESRVYRRWQPLPAFRYKALAGPQDGSLADWHIDDSHWETLPPDGYWSWRSTDFVLRTRFQVPAEWDANEPTALYLPLSRRGEYCRPETLAYVDGQPWAGIDGNHQELLLTREMRDGQAHLLALRGWTGRNRDGEPEAGKQPYLHTCGLVQIDQTTRNFVAAARVALGVANHLGDEVPARAYLLNGLDDAFRLLELREGSSDVFYARLPAAQEALERGIGRAGQPLDVDIVATGHSHLDVAWLWDLGQTRRKAGRTFHSVLRLMEQFPDYHFTQSQPQLYDYVRQDYPELFEEIQQRVREGRWEPIGGMWVEADCNISGGEALVRQLLLGRSFFRQHFGRAAESPVLWLPDVFGYAWQLPQLMRQAGLAYFFTVKLSWNRYNRIPYDSFWWQGLDGSRVLTHFSSTPDGGRSATYNAMATPEEALGTWTNYQQKELRAPLLMAYGYGDGGGGPTREMLENIRQMNAFPGAPRTCQGSVRDFFERVEAAEGEHLPVWNGELYFEMHRGTYTTQARNKRANRQSEFLLHDAEFLATLAAQADPAYEYPAAEFQEAWQILCLNQFHDIIPGSSIGKVYEDSQLQYAELRQRMERVRDRALTVLGAGARHGQLAGPTGSPVNGKANGMAQLETARQAQVSVTGAAHGAGDFPARGSRGRAEGLDAKPGQQSLLLVNPAPFTRSDLAFWPGELPEGQGFERADGTEVPSQRAADGTWLAAGEVAPYSGTIIRMSAMANVDRPSPARAECTGTGAVLENDRLRVEFNQAGDIKRIYDREQDREVLPAGAIANQFQAFEDRPNEWDAWDIDMFYDDKTWLASPAEVMAVAEAGPLRATIQIRRHVLNSEITQNISLRSGGKRLDFQTQIDWHERHTLLKVGFPVEILSPVATYEIQWGNLQRPTHRSTSWDWARFEACAQKWVDLSEGDYGVSLLNDCKYGHDIQDNVLRLTLLRSPTAPDPEADQGRHGFTYSLLPHSGPLNEETACEAYLLNDPIIVHGAGHGAASFDSFVRSASPNVILETVKQAEDGHGIVVRLYESQRRRGPVTLHTSFPVAAAWRIDLLEEKVQALQADDHEVVLAVRPFEIVTVRIVPARTV